MAEKGIAPDDTEVSLLSRYKCYARELNLVPEACEGCYIADGTLSSLPVPWLISSHEVDVKATLRRVKATQYSKLDDVPMEDVTDDGGVEEEGSHDDDPLVQIHVEPTNNDRGILGVVNLCSLRRRAAYLSLVSCSAGMSLVDAGTNGAKHSEDKENGNANRLIVSSHNGEVLPVSGTSLSILQNSSHSESHSKHPRVPCITFVVIMQPATLYNLCYISMSAWKSGSLQLHKFSFQLDLHPIHSDLSNAQREEPGQKGLDEAVAKLNHFPSNADILPKDSNDINTVPTEIRAHPTAWVDIEHINSRKAEYLVLDHFPLRQTESQQAFLCTQGCGGRLTHFFPESFHAVDFRCEYGTECLAATDGTIVEVEQDSSITGIHCQNLGCWNSIGLKTLDGKYVIDYVHIAPQSAKVQVGDKVVKGQVICLTGDVGFSPEPHVHVEVHHANDPTGPSVPFRLRNGDGEEIVPLASRWYNNSGEVIQ